MADIFFSLIFLTRDFSLKGSRKLTNKVLSLILPNSFSVRFLTLQTISDEAKPSSRFNVFTPRSSKSLSLLPRCSAKDFSIEILKPLSKNFLADSKVKETLVSDSGSFGKKIFI